MKTRDWHQITFWGGVLAFGFLFFVLVALLAILPGLARAESWAWDPASGPVTGYQIEDSSGTARTAASNSISIQPLDPMRKIRVRATDGASFGPWSPWSFRVGFNPDVDGDGFVLPSDLTDGFLPAFSEGREWPH